MYLLLFSHFYSFSINFCVVCVLICPLIHSVFPSFPEIIQLDPDPDLTTRLWLDNTMLSEKLCRAFWKAFPIVFCFGSIYDTRCLRCVVFCFVIQVAPCIALRVSAPLVKRRPTLASVQGHVESECFTSVASAVVSEPKGGYPGRILALPRVRFQKVTKTPLSFSDSDDRLNI